MGHQSLDKGVGISLANRVLFCLTLLVFDKQTHTNSVKGRLMGKSSGLSDQKYGIALIGMTSELCETFTVRLDLMTGWFFFGRKKDFAK